MDVRVLPPVRQGIQWGYDDEWATVLNMNFKLIVVPKLTDEETLLGEVESDEEEEIERKGEEEEEVEQPPSEYQISWENEFREELDGQPVDEEVEEFVLNGDLAYLEALLEGSPMTNIKQEEEEEHQSWPVVLITNAGKSLKPQEKDRSKIKEEGAVKARPVFLLHAVY
ncbi:hypothetical protein HanHA89_Chr02g0051981 [Helianthus annuus]|nr:hypothetical protein HanHA89_Chr02g0051981 [Helianthus annuus]